jgi:hypothetical protein
MERSPIVQTRVRSTKELKAFAGAHSAAGPDSAPDTSSTVVPHGLFARCRRVASDGPRQAVVAGLSVLALGVTMPAYAQNAPVVSVGAGLRTSFVHTQFKNDDVDTTDESFDNFTINDIRLYVNGSVTKNIKLTFNTDYDPSSNSVKVLDAVGQLAFSPKANIWMGRFLPPSDRPNLTGPFYAHSWNVFANGLQDSYPMVFQGRANGAMYWGQFSKVKVSAGVFDGPSLVLGGAGDFGGDPTTLLSAARVQIDFLDPEDGYYQNATYYGGKNVLAVGIAGQVQGQDHSAWTADFLYEKKVGMGGAYSIEAEWARYSQLGLTFSPSDTTDGGYLLGSYLFPHKSGPGQWEILGQFAQANLKGFGPKETLRTTEGNLNYILKQFDARVMFFFLNQRFDINESANTWKAGVGLQLQM